MKLFSLLLINIRRLLSANQLKYAKTGRSGSRFGMTLLLIFVAVMLLFSVTSYFMILAKGLAAAGLCEITLATALIAACAVMVLDTLFNANSIIYSFKDYDIVMSLPLKKSTVVASRLITLYTHNLFLSLLLLIPAGIAYVLTAPYVPVVFYPLYIVCIFIAPLLPVAVATPFGVLIGAMTSRFKYRNALKAIFTMLLLLVYFVFIFSGMGNIENIGQETVSLVTSMSRAYPVAMWLASGVTGDIYGLLMFLASNVVPALLISWIICVSFFKAHELIVTKKTSSGFRLSGESIKNSSVKSALFKKEMKQYLSSSIYLMNTIFGLVLVVLASAAALIFKGEIFSVINGDDFAPLRANLPYLLSCFVAMLVSLSCTTYGAISMEGKCLPFLKSLPVSYMDIFRAKLKVFYTLAIPAMFVSSTMLVFAFEMTDIFGIVFMYALPLIFILFMGVYGLYINTVFPKLDWTNETQYAKQSVASFMGIFTGMLLGLALFLCIMFLPTINPRVLCIAFLAFMCALALVFYELLKHDGVKRLARLN